MNWELRKVEDIECTLDDSGIYTIINRIPCTACPALSATVRLDLMPAVSSDEPAPLHGPIMSWQGTANNVRKAVVKFTNLHLFNGISREHASYIGYELHRAETDPNYVQD